jgi:hypothetical protein
MSTVMPCCSIIKISTHITLIMLVMTKLIYLLRTIAVPGTYAPPGPMTSTMVHTPSLPSILFVVHKLPTSVKAHYDAYQAGILLHYTIFKNDFLWEDGTLHKYYENDQVAYIWIFLNNGALFYCPYNPKAFKKDPWCVLMNHLLVFATGPTYFNDTAMLMVSIFHHMKTFDLA